MSPAKSLSSFPRPNVAVDIAVLTVAPATETSDDVGRLSVLVLRRDEEPNGVLPGRFMRERRTINETVQEVLELKLGLEPGDISPTLLRVFDDPHRDERAWTLSIAHAVTLSSPRLSGCAAEVVPIGLSGDLATGEKLGFDHNEIVREAVAAMRDRYETAPDPDGLLEGPFTLSELRRLHEVVLGERLRKDTFNRRMEQALEVQYDEAGSPATRRGTGRPAQLFRVRSRGVSAPRRWRLPRA
jgi:ADP-ribose pyrophosphatase YjhB (NUDIX family)